MSSRVSRTSWGEGALEDQPYSDSVTIKIPYGLNVLLPQPASHLFLLDWLMLNLTLLLE